MTEAAAFAFVTTALAAAVGFLAGAVSALLDWMAAKGTIWLSSRAAVSVARRREGQARLWYTRKPLKNRSSRHYHIFGLHHCVGARAGSFWRLYVGPFAFIFGMRSAGARHYKGKS